VHRDDVAVGVGERERAANRAVERRGDDAAASAVEDQMLAPLSTARRQELTNALRACIDALT
jgi:hypothetical protein